MSFAGICCVLSRLECCVVLLTSSECSLTFGCGVGAVSRCLMFGVANK